MQNSFLSNKFKYDLLKSIKPDWLLIAGTITMTMSHLSFNIDIAGWIAMVPFLVYLHMTRGWIPKLKLFITLVITWSVIVFKIITDPVPYFLIPLYSVPISLFHLPGYLVYSRFKDHSLSVLVFPATMVIMEWVQYSFTPFASWGIAAYTQSETVSMMQTVSLFGMPGLSFLLYWSNSALADLVINRKATLTNFKLPLGIIIICLVFGSIRYELGNSKENKMIKVAAIGTDSDVAGLPLPSQESNEAAIRAILDRTVTAAISGAQLAVWTEAAFFLLPSQEDQWMDSVSRLARNHHIAIVASYVVPVSESPFRFENKYVFFDTAGKRRDEYHKQQPVPGEPALKGTGPSKIIEIGGSEIGGAICYDYDFPFLARNNSKAGADIVALPSSDWKGIDPLHTRMAAFRALEQGHSIVRSTRFGLSAAITPYGEFSAMMSSFDANKKIMIAELPAEGFRTAYYFIGDTVIYLSILFLMMISLPWHGIKVFSRRS